MRAYGEIREFERMLTADGVDMIKIFLAVSPEEQLKRFKERMENPYKRWKLTLADVHAREKWDDYVRAADELLRKCESRAAPWQVIPSDHKLLAHEQVVARFSHHAHWLEARRDSRLSAREVARALKRLSAIK